MPTRIEYVDETINPIRTKEGGWHCVKSSIGCLNCYAEKINLRFGDGKLYTKRDVGLVLNQKALEKPLKWKKSKKIFIQDMSDLFLPGIDSMFPRYLDSKYLCQIIDLIKETAQHVYIMLTKHPQEMKESFMGVFGDGPDFWHEPLHFDNGKPLKNLILGITCETQKTFDERWQHLKQIPAAVYMISHEPALGSLVLPDDFLALGKRTLVVCGGESGPKARPMHPNWARGIRDQCVEAGVPFFFKQWGEWGPANTVNDKISIENVKGNPYMYFANSLTKSRPPGNVCYFTSDTKKISGYIGLNYTHFDKETLDKTMIKVGKKAAGRLLDGKTYNQFPEGR